MTTTRDLWRGMIPAGRTKPVMPQPQEDDEWTLADIPVVGSIAKNAKDNFVGMVGTGLKGLGALSKGIAQQPTAPAASLGEWLDNNGTYLNNLANEGQAKYGASQEYENRDLTDLLTDLGYLTDPRGLRADVGAGLGSSIPFALLTLLAPEVAIPGRIAGAIGSGASRIGLNKIGQAIGSNAVKDFANKAVQYNVLTTPVDAFINNSERIDDLRKQGMSDWDIVQNIAAGMAEEMPVDAANNALFGHLITGNWGKYASKGLDKVMPNSPRAAKALGYGSSLPVDMLSEYLQEMNQEIVNDKYSGKEYGTWFNPTPNEKTAGVKGAVGAIGMGGYGAYQSYRGDQQEERRQRDIERIDAENEEKARQAYRDQAEAEQTRADEQLFTGRQAQGRTSLFGVDDYNMPTQGDRITAQVQALNPKWQSVIPQIGGVLKNKFGMDAVISSAARDPEHNRAVGGAERSYHRTDATEQGGDALDIVLPDGATAEQAESIKKYFKDSGMFNEVLFHDVGSGYHLHLGGLRADSGNQQQQKRSADINSFMAAIAGQESGGSSDPYNLTNPDSGATGKFQIMPENWSSWAQDAGLSPDAPMTQENQNLVAKNKMLEYYNKFGNWRDVAIAWYGGEGAVGYSESAKNRPQGKYPSINQYADEVMGRLEKIVGSSVDTSTQAQAQGQSYSNPTTQEQEQAQQQNEQSATKPLFDLNAEDDGSKSTLEMYNKFVEMFTNTAQGQQAAEVQNFFSTENGMLNRRGEFIDNAENRARIREEYPTELTDFANSYLSNQQMPSTTSTSPVETRQTTQTVNNTQQQKMTPQTPKTPNLDSLKYAQTQGVNKWIRRLQRALNVAQEPVSKSVDRRRVQAMAHQILADELGIKLPEKITPYLQEGAEKAINAAHKELDSAGVFKLNKDNIGSYAYDYLQNKSEDNRKARERQQEEEDFNRELAEEQAGRQNVYNAVSNFKNQRQRQELTEIVGADYVNKLSNDEYSKLSQTKNALTIGLTDIDKDNQQSRTRQAKGLKVALQSEHLRAFTDKAVSIPSGLIEGLERNYPNAIAKAQDILREAGVKIGNQQQQQSENRLQGISGNTAELTSDNGKTRVQARYQVAEVDDLIDSDNKNYPQELQPRDRDHVALREQVEQIINNPKAEMLMESLNANQGAPTVRNDGVVLNGNGRVMGLRGAYQQGNADSYKQAIIDNAEKFGLDKEAIAKMKNPVLIRVPTHNLTDEEMQEVITSTTGGSRMSTTDQAAVDSKKLSESDFNGYQVDKNGNIDFTLKSNRDFLGNILGKVANQNDIAAYTSKDGAINKSGIEKAKNALYAAAYQDDGLIETLAESPDNNIKNITTALTNAAPDFAAMNTRIANGKQVDLGLAKDISDAVKKLSNLRDEGQTVGDYLRSEQFENDEYSGTQTKDSAAMREILAGLDENKDNVKNLTDFLKSMVRSANELGDTRQENIFGESEKASAEDIIKSTRKANKPDSENTSQENVKKSNEAKAEKPKADLEELTENEASIYTLVPAGKGISVDELLMKSDEIFEEPLSVPEVLKILDNLEQKEYIKENDLGDYVRAAKEDSHLSWIEKHPFKYNNKKSVEQNMEAAEKLAQEYLAKFNDTTTINTEGRKNLRRQIIDDLYGEGAEKKERKAFIVMGLPASGKSSAVAEPLAKEHGALIIDSDMAKEKLPEFQLSNGILATAVHNESSNIAEIIIGKAISNNDNIVLPVVGTIQSDVQKRISALKSNGYEINLHYVDLPLEKALERAENRFKDTGRLVPKKYISSVGLNPKLNYDILKKKEGIDSYAEWSNDVARGQRPRLLERSEKKSTNEKSGGLLGREQDNSPLSEMRQERSSKQESERAPAEAEPKATTKTVENEDTADDKGGISVSEGKSKGKGKVKKLTPQELSDAIDDLIAKWSRNGQGKVDIKAVDPKDLTKQQRGIAEFGDQLGVPVVYFKGSEELNGAHANGITYINVNSKVNPRWIFWHESGHWLKAQHPELISDIIEKLGISKKQVDDFRERTKRYDLTDDEIREEIFADNMFDADKRLDILQTLGKKDASVLDRLVSWLKSIMDKFTSYFNTPKYGLTNTQKNQMFDELGKGLRQIKENGKPRYRYGNTTHVVQYADGRELPQVAKNSVDNSENISDNEVNDIAPEVSDNGDRVSANTRIGRYDEKTTQNVGNDRQRGIYQTGNRTIRNDQRSSGRRSGSQSSMALTDKHSDKLSAFLMAEDKVQYVRNLISDANIEVITDPEEVERVWKISYKSPLNEVTGFKSPDGKIYINVNHPEFKAKPNNQIRTHIHELTHIWDAVMQVKNPAFWKQGVELMKTKAPKKWNEVYEIYKKRFPNIANNEDLLASEVHAKLTGEKGLKIFDTQNAGPLEKLFRWMRQYWQKIRDTLFSKSEKVQNMSLDDFVKAPLYDLIESENSKIGDEYRKIYPQKATTLKAETAPEQTDNSGIINSFRHPLDTLAKKFHLNSDKIITDEDRKARQREQQIEAMDKFLADPSKENLEAARKLGVTKGMLNAYKNGEEYVNDIGVYDTIAASPSTLAGKVQIFRAFYRMAERAMKKLILSRDSYGRKLANVFRDLSKDDMKTLNDLLVAGDAERIDYSELSREERDALGDNAGHKEYDKARVDKVVKEQGVNESVAKAFVKIRQLITKMANEIDKARRTPQSVSKWLTDKEIEDLKNNKFVIEVRKIGDHETKNGKRLVSWKEYKHFEPEKPYTIDEATLDRFERDDSIQILSKRKLPDGMYEVKTREQLGRINRIQGYIPHLFHEYMIRVVDKDGKPVDKYGYGGVINSGRTQNEAVNIAEEWLKNNQLADGEEIYIAPKMANFGKEFEDAYAPIMGDKDYDTMVHKIAENNGIKLKDAKEFVKDSVRLRNRHRFFGNLLKRQGANGYITDMQYVLRHYFNSGARYVALETEFKPQAISLFERVFGAFGDDWSGNSLAKYTKDYINDVNGNPTHMETILNKALNSNGLFRKFITSIWGERASITLAADINSLVAYAKLGVFSVSSALLNYTQLINAGGYLGGYGGLFKHAKRLIGHKLTQNEIRILAEAGTLQDIGLDTSTSYDKSRGYGNLLMRLGDKSMYLFKKADMHCRIATTFAAYEKALADGKSRREAIAFAKEVNRKANFSYGIEDAPNMFRRTGPIGKIALQFQKYPVKQLEVMADMLSSKTTRQQKIAFWVPYFFAVGLMGFIPAGGWLDDLVKKLSGYSPKDLVQSTAMKWAGNDSTKKEIAKIAMYGAGAVFNVDTSKRAGLTDLMPQDFTSFIIGPTGSTIKNAIGNAAIGFQTNGLPIGRNKNGEFPYLFSIYDSGGDYAAALRAVSPGAYNILSAFFADTTKGKRGRTNTVYEDIWDRIIRGAGFKSVDEAVQADTKQILNNEQTRYNKERQKVIDALVEDPYDKEAQKKARELGIKGDQVREERKKKKQTYRERTESGMSKRQKQEYQYLVDFAK